MSAATTRSRGVRPALDTAATALLLLALAAAPLALGSWLLGVALAWPAGLLLLPGAGAGVMLLHMLRPRTARRVVGSLLLWQQVARAQQAGTPLARLRRSLPLFLLLLALALLAFALARPIVQGAAEPREARVIVLDTSASMLAADVPGARNRFEAARTRALELVAGLGPGGRATVIAADHTAWTAVPWTDDVEALTRGIAALEPRHTGTALADGLSLAAAPDPRGGGPAAVHLLSDGGGPPLPPVQLPGPLRFEQVGTRGDNLGVVTIDLRPRRAVAAATSEEEGGGEEPARPAAAEAASRYEVFASIRNAGAAPREVFVGLEREGRLLAARRLRLAGGADAPVVLEAALSPGPVAVRLLPIDPRGAVDDHPLDDRAWAVVPEESGEAVGLVAAGPSPALERALEAAGARVRRLAPGEPLTDPEVVLYVFEGHAPDELPRRDCVLIAPDRPVGPVRPRAGPELERPRPGGWDRDDPLLRFVDLSDVEVLSARGLELGAGGRALLSGDAGEGGEPVTLVAAWRDGRHQRLAIGFDIYRSSWPLRASFPIFVRNWLLQARERSAVTRRGVPAGTPVAIPVPEQARSARVTTPWGEEVEVAARDGEALFHRTEQVGVYVARTDHGPEQRFCVNVGDPEETRIAPRTPGGEVRLAPPGGGTRTRDISAWFLLAGLVALAVEAAAFHRRW